MRRAEGGRRGGRDQRRLHGHYDAEGHRAAPREVGPSAAGGEVPPAAQAAVQEPLQIEDHPSEWLYLICGGVRDSIVIGLELSHVSLPGHLKQRKR